eukprot:scaffold6414_cov19-Tisochrysis_lutea.AAC.2
MEQAYECPILRRPWKTLTGAMASSWAPSSSSSSSSTRQHQMSQLRIVHGAPAVLRALASQTPAKNQVPQAPFFQPSGYCPNWQAARAFGAWQERGRKAPWDGTLLRLGCCPPKAAWPRGAAAAAAAAACQRGTQQLLVHTKATEAPRDLQFLKPQLPKPQLIL